MLEMPALNRRTALLAIGLGLVLVAATAGAERPWRLPRPVPSYRVAIESADGSVLPTFRHQGRTFVLGVEGEGYAVRVDNPTGERIEAVVSVDGRDAVSGAIGDYRSQRGYVIPPYGSVRVEGFRRSLDAVAAFRFSSPGKSYSARRGTPENVGVIGVAVFREKARPAPQPLRRAEEPRPFPRRERSADETRGASPSEGAAAPKSRSAGRSAPSKSEARKPAAPEAYDEPRGEVNNLGTEYGEARSSSVVEVPFTRRSAEPDRLFTLRYDDVEGLESRGIDVSSYFDYSRPRAYEPEAFPRSRFAEPPP
jgi:hypothetical protein